MPRYSTERAFQLGDYWLSRRSGSPAWYRAWFDPKTRQTRRASLGTADFDEAKQRLTDWFVLEHTKTEQPAEDVTLAEVFARFYAQHGEQLRTAQQVQSTLNLWLDFHGEATVAEAADQRQQDRFRQWLATEKGLSLSSIRRALLVGKSALNWAWKRGEIAQVPYIPLVTPPKPEPKGRPLEIGEVASLLAEAREHHIQVLIAFMLGTAARTGAVLDLTLAQIDAPRRLIQLNPPGRPQTLKYRPTVKLPAQLKDYIVHRQRADAEAALVTYQGAAVSSVKTSWRKLRTDTDLAGNVQTYSFRHTMARWLRMQSVPAWEVAAQLGHKSADYSTTEIYAPFDPAYLSKATEAIDDFLGHVACQLRAKSMSEFLLRSA